LNFVSVFVLQSGTGLKAGGIYDKVEINDYSETNSAKRELVYSPFQMFSKGFRRITPCSKKASKLRGFNPQAYYTDRETAACRRS
jgi:hypothetical protein